MKGLVLGVVMFIYAVMVGYTSTFVLSRPNDCPGSRLFYTCESGRHNSAVFAGMFWPLYWPAHLGAVLATENGNG